MKTTNFQVELTDISAKTEALLVSASFLAELSAITEKNHKSAEIFGYYKSPRKIGSASDSFLSRQAPFRSVM